MKSVKSTVTYQVPHWNYCNSDNLVDGELTRHVCRFCVKDPDTGGRQCLLYGESLTTNGKLISKVRECCKATAGHQSSVTVPPASTTPVVPPRDLMKQTIDLYVKTVKDLKSQGYPQAIAEAAAKKYVLDK